MYLEEWGEGGEPMGRDEMGHGLGRGAGCVVPLWEGGDNILQEAVQEGLWGVWGPWGPWGEPWGLWRLPNVTGRIGRIGGV